MANELLYEPYMHAIYVLTVRLGLTLAIFLLFNSYMHPKP